MKAKTLVFLALIVSLATLGHAQRQQRLDEGAQKGLRDRLSLSQEALVIQRALQNGQPHDLFLDRNVQKDHNFHYSIELKTPVITNQKSTGRCWLYAGLNAIRPHVAERLGLDSFEFSTNYLFFWDKMEKANAFLERVLELSDLPVRDMKFQKLIGDPIGDGGYWQNAVDLVKKYGVMPAEAMPELAANEKSSSMNSVLGVLLRQGAYRLHQLKSDKKEGTIVAAKQEILDQVYRILVLHLGEPVSTFSFRHKVKDEKGDMVWTPYQDYTPQSFAQAFVKEDMGDYVMFANWPARAYNTYYQWQYSNNVLEGTPMSFVNLPMEQIREMMIASLKGGEPVNFSADVGKQLDRKRGIMHPQLYPYDQIYGVPLQLEKKRDSLLGNINSTHAMVITGVDLKGEKPLKWKVENSWGSDSGHKGFYAMYDPWVDLFVVRVVIHKRFVPEKILKLLNTRAQVLPFYESEQ